MGMVDASLGKTDDAGAAQRRPAGCPSSDSTTVPPVPTDPSDDHGRATARPPAPSLDRPRTRRPRRAQREVDDGNAGGDERRAAPRPPLRTDLAPETAQAVYRRVMRTLSDGGVRFLVGGAYAFTPFTGIPRSTKDFDVFIAKTEIRRALDVLTDAGFRTELTFPHWLGKAYSGADFVDLIFSSGNGVAPVDEGWFEHAPRGTVLGVDVLLAPAEEMLWSKAFVMERERYDGGDVIHLLRARAERLDWDRVLRRFGPHWRVLLSCLVLYGFVYPGERSRVPRWVMDTLLARLAKELDADADVGRLCQGTILSRQQYLPDVLEWGYRDGRLSPLGTMSAHEIADWTAAIGTRP
jgi:hypothetical protein